MKKAKTILLLDAGGGLLVGFALLIFQSLASNFLGWPQALTYIIAFANLTYGLYSASILMRLFLSNKLTKVPIKILISANLTWSVACSIIIFLFYKQMTIFGVGHVFLEGIFVAVLAIQERKNILPLVKSISNKLS